METPLDSVVVRARDLRISYAGQSVAALDLADLEVQRAGMTAIVGPSGSGKSTLVEMIAGSLRIPYSGSLQVLGREQRDVRSDAQRQRQLRRIGLVSQDFALVRGQTVAGTIAQALGDAGVPVAEHAVRSAAALAKVKLSGNGDTLTNAISGGERQRLAIARALARDVEMLVLDEPTANLDGAMARSVVSLLTRLSREIPVLVVTHDERIAAACDHRVQVYAPERTVVFAAPAATRSAARFPGNLGIQRAALAGAALVAVAALGLPMVQKAAPPTVAALDSIAAAGRDAAPAAATAGAAAALRVEHRSERVAVASYRATTTGGGVPAPGAGMPAALDSRPVALVRGAAARPAASVKTAVALPVAATVAVPGVVSVSTTPVAVDVLPPAPAPAATPAPARTGLLGLFFPFKMFGR